MAPARAQVGASGSFPLLVINAQTPARLNIGTRMDVLLDPTRNLTLEQVWAPPGLAGH